MNDVCAELPLQELLNHTARRLLSLQQDIILHLSSDKSVNYLEVKLKVKWGFDGSSNQSQYNQRFVDPTSGDSHLFATTLVPLQITLVRSDSIVVWNNSTPQSSRWCRPLRLRFAKETKELILSEKKSVEQEIQQLKAFNVSIAGINVLVDYDLYLTMIDGKVLAVVTMTDSIHNCCICGATPKDFNSLSDISNRFKPNANTLHFGLSVLHLWIRSFEWMLHLSYRIFAKTWQMRGPKLRGELETRKADLQKRFLAEMSLRVDFPSSQGAGNTNNGPLARAAFGQPETLAKVLSIEEDLIKKISTILITLSCHLPIDEDKFSNFCLQTAKYYVSLYVWFPMPPSIHKLLIHSKDIMLANNLPVGMLAEDSAEHCNKLYRHNRQFHARKQSRQFNLTDVFNRAMDSSDPMVASFNQQKRLNSRNRKPIPSEVLELLKVPAYESHVYDESDDECEQAMSFAELEHSDNVCLPEDTYYAECC